MNSMQSLANQLKTQGITSKPWRVIRSDQPDQKIIQIRLGVRNGLQLTQSIKVVPSQTNQTKLARIRQFFVEYKQSTLAQDQFIRQKLNSSTMQSIIGGKNCHQVNKNKIAKVFQPRCLGGGCGASKNVKETTKRALREKTRHDLKSQHSPNELDQTAFKDSFLYDKSQDLEINQTNEVIDLAMFAHNQFKFQIIDQPPAVLPSRAKKIIQELKESLISRDFENAKSQIEDYKRIDLRQLKNQEAITLEFAELLNLEHTQDKSSIKLRFQLVSILYVHTITLFHFNQSKGPKDFSK